MPAPTFSINGAAELLERDRRSIQKSLRHVPPDKTERGVPRWTLKTILRALDKLPKAALSKQRRSRNEEVVAVVHHNWLNPMNWRDARIVGALAEFNDAFAEMKAITDIEQRRAFAVAKLAPLIDHHDKNFRGWETDNPAPGQFSNDDDAVCARVSLLWSQQMEAMSEACGWTGDEGRKFLHDPFIEDD
jgi:hypothetical protein